MVLDCQNISKSFGDNLILSNVSFHLEDHDKASIVGINGAGKTTLIKTLLGEYPADEGSVFLSSGITVGYLSQNETVDSDHTIYEELLMAQDDLVTMEKKLREMETEMSSLSGEELNRHMDSYDRLSTAFKNAGGLSYQSEITGTLRGLGFDEDEQNRNIGTLSGGEKTRVALTRLLIRKPDLLILDEPTNHLDLNAIAFLENLLLNYKGAVLIVSHDRYFLDKITNKVIEIENTHATVYEGNYSQYAVKKEARRNELLSLWAKQQNMIAHEEAVIKKLREFNREKSIRRAESRVKKLSRLDRLEKPADLNDAMSIALMPDKTSGNDVLTVTDLSKSFDGRTLFRDLSFSLKRGEHVALIGDNGSGKTTILKILNGFLLPDSGQVLTGTNVSIAYYDQEHHVLHEDKTLFEELQDDYPSLDNTAIRNTLAAFLFTGDDVFKRISALSGGEKGRVSLAKLMLSRANFLILDEPTNHLDITSREILEDALNSFEGTVLYVSHDRYFINRTAHRILDLCGNTLTGYLGDYDYYAEKKGSDTGSGTHMNTLLKGRSTKESIPSSSSSTGALDYKAQKEEAALKRKKENDLNKCEARIAFLEEENKKIDREMSLPTNASNSVKLQELSQKQTKNSDELTLLYEQWETLASD